MEQTEKKNQFQAKATRISVFDVLTGVGYFTLAFPGCPYCYSIWCRDRLDNSCGASYLCYAVALLNGISQTALREGICVLLQSQYEGVMKNSINQS